MEANFYNRTTKDLLFAGSYPSRKQVNDRLTKIAKKNA